MSDKKPFEPVTFEIAKPTDEQRANRTLPDLTFTVHNPYEVRNPFATHRNPVDKTSITIADIIMAVKDIGPLPPAPIVRYEVARDVWAMIAAEVPIARGSSCMRVTPIGSIHVVCIDAFPPGTIIPYDSDGKRVDAS